MIDLMFALLLAVAGFCALVAGIFALIGILILRANQKMYTEYFKDRSISARQINKKEVGGE